jgi:hypothetical protein
MLLYGQPKIGSASQSVQHAASEKPCSRSDLFRGTHNIRYSWIHRFIGEIWIFYGYIAGFIKLLKILNVKKLSFLQPYKIKYRENLGVLE